MKLLAILFLTLININLIFPLVWNGNFAEFSKWNIKKTYLEQNREVVNDPKGGSAKVLKVKYPAGTYSVPPLKGGTGFFVYPFENQLNNVEQATLEFEVLFPSEFNFVKGGKLPGLFGGKTDCAGGDMALDCFSTRLMFGENGNGYGYLYVSKVANHTQEFCKLTTAPNCSPKYGYGIGGGKYFEKDRWIKVKQLVKLNQVGKQNGKFTIWVDNVVKFDFDKMVFRTTNVSITGLEFETFFGGGEDWATPKEVYSYFRNLRIETF